MAHHKFFEIVGHSPIKSQRCSNRAPFIIYRHESSTLAKTYGIKMQYYWKQLGEPFGNVMGTFWQHIENKKKKSLKIIKIWNMYKIGLGSGSSSNYRG